jgi:hypothetical protein
MLTRHLKSDEFAKARRANSLPGDISTGPFSLHMQFAGKGRKDNPLRDLRE